ncbi:FUSC family protein [Tumebacillus flagellatus]|uniref:FUSC family protein n=1 Tax=Tumebacillus flagellatus TaxID=1157490 RepID=UPI001377B642|nr:FUSC family protein [Tumebacillus flagellatus]
MKNKLKTFLSQNSIVCKNALGCALSWEIGSLVGSKHPYLAPLAVILCLQITVVKTLRHALQRILGSVIGVLLTAYVAQLFGMHGWSIGLMILIGTGVAKALKLGNQVIHQVALTTVLVLTFENKSPQYAFDRIWESVIGAAVAVLLNLLVLPPNLTEQATTALVEMKSRLSDAFYQAASWLEKGLPAPAAEQIKSESQKLLDTLHRTEKQHDTAAKSLKYNPLSKKSQADVQQSKQDLELLQQGVVHYSTMTHTLLDWASSGLMTRQDQRLWAEQFHRFAEVFSPGEAGKAGAEGVPRIDASLPALAPEAEPYKYSMVLQQDAAQFLRKLHKS